MKDFKWSDITNPKKPVFIIAEAGSNWKSNNYDGDIKQAKKLIDVASKAGANAIKFQTYRVESVYVPNAGNVDYLKKGKTTEQITDIFKHHEMPYEMIPILSDHCKEKNILFMSSPFSIQDTKEIDPFVDLHKVASFEINHVRFLENLAKINKPIIISTGASTYDEIDFVVNLFKENQHEQIALLQCTSKYPSPIDAINLKTIPELQKRYNLPIGFSDHSIDPIICPILSVAYGARIIEKHFTLNKNLPGPDHSFALEPNELKLMIKSIRLAEKTIGNGIKSILLEEEQLRRFATRAIQAIRDINQGEILQDGVNIAVLRPGEQSRGIEPRFLDSVNGKRASKNIKMGEGIMGYN
ncbi:MAG: N-acylneuraminate-9-phosphate synthase [Thaumarchaeota archaeon]|jgi:N-acetylneuraminate synthase|nr:MAG: N-acylneuraminate-9-phosphate synthase [Nitrososphaerota archaeon]